MFAGVLIFLHPLQVKVVSHPFDALPEDDDHSALAHGEPGVVHGLLELIDVDVLGVAPAGGDHQVGPAGDRRAVNALHEFAGFQVGLDVIARVHLQKLFLFVEHHVQQERRPQHLGAFDLVFIDRVPLELAHDRRPGRA